jgi:hypothetical protein
LRGGGKVATIQSMTENELTPEPESDVPEIPAEDKMFAPPEDVHDEALIVEDIAEVEDEPLSQVEPVEPVVLNTAMLDIGPPADDWMPGDIDAALAAVATLSEIMTDREAEAQARADAKQSASTFVSGTALPPLTTLKRGQLGSIVPALLLIGFGAWLTLTTTGGNPPDPLLVASVVVGGLVLTLLAQWLGTRRWSRGVLFFALFVLFVAGLIAYATQPTGIDLRQGYPLLLVAPGLAMVLTGVLSRPLNVRLLAPGVLLVVAGVVGLLVTLGVFPANPLATAASLAPVVLIIVLVLYLLPLIFRRRRSRA